MATSTVETSMTGQEIVDLTKKHTLFEWSAQAKVDPIPVAKAKGIYFWTPEGKRFIDFNSQLMSVNIGHGDERAVGAGEDGRRAHRVRRTLPAPRRSHLHPGPPRRDGERAKRPRAGRTTA